MKGFLGFSANHLLLILSCLLFLTGSVKGFWPLPVPRNTDAPALESRFNDLVPNAFAMLADKSFYSSINEHPLFTTDRKTSKSAAPMVEPDIPTYSTPNAPPVGVVAVQPTFKIIGIVSTPEASIALISTAASSQLLRLKVNDQVEGWQVTIIENNRLVLSNGVEQQILYLTQPDPARTFD